ncbi:energy-coupling factor ABC transporter ATP-binding protein [Lactobacillus sp. CC-MHH1034]|uniref:energy-coupling factor ABC transporter ATP-binding protein n=1 Tax=Agrilactobacillus fermenti TaxID=2586909 RepID=UPI001E3E6E12|nr:energy-coupling factor ABC transporter ATP-binding protein [Agrilactobacillus fermenti]MCD2255352.1 energy-coupling factor ABC transporter ATP-binding protein [Agrilactobacillus fermenti]
MNSLEVQNLYFKYSSEATDYILKDINFQIEAGEWVAIVGHNGSGKSTLTKNLNGILAPTKGRVIVQGVTLAEATVWDIRRKIGIVFQNPDNQFVGATVADDVAFGLENRAMPYAEMHQRVHDALAAVDMLAYERQEPAHLSGGQKQRVALAGIIAMAPDIIILDEATSMLDPDGRKQVIATVQQLQARRHNTILSVTHDLEEAALADRVLVLNNGELIASGTPSKVFSQPKLLKKIGLDAPFTQRIKQALIHQGLKLPDGYLNSSELIEALWTLNSKM